MRKLLKVAAQLLAYCALLFSLQNIGFARSSEGQLNYCLIQAPFGTGHLNAALGIAGNILEAQPNANVYMLDVSSLMDIVGLRHFGIPTNILGKASVGAYEAATRSPIFVDAWDALYFDYVKRMGRIQDAAEMHGAKMSFPTKRVGAVINAIQCDVIIGTWYFSAEIVARLKKLKLIPQHIPHALLVTDLVGGDEVTGPYIANLAAATDVAFMPNQRIADYVNAALHNQGRIRQPVAISSGISISKDIERIHAMSLEDLKPFAQKYGISLNMRTNIIQSGGSAVGDFRIIAEELVSLLRPGEAMQIIAICGNNEVNRRHLLDLRMHLKHTHPLAKLVIIGGSEESKPTSEVVLMANRLVSITGGFKVGKAGGVAMTEDDAIGVFGGYTPGNKGPEKKNIEEKERNGTGVGLVDEKDVAEKLAHAWFDPDFVRRAGAKARAGFHESYHPERITEWAHDSGNSSPVTSAHWDEARAHMPQSVNCAFQFMEKPKIMYFNAYNRKGRELKMGELFELHPAKGARDLVHR